jgi:hypothetical protein
MSSALALPCRMVTVAIASSIFTSIMGAVLREGRQGIRLNPYGAKVPLPLPPIQDTAKLSWLRKLRKHEPAGRIELHCAMVASRSNQIFHAVVDTNGLPVRLELSAGEAHDNRLVLKLLSRLRSGSMLLADRGYDADWIRAFVTKKGAWANVPPRCNRTEPICFSAHTSIAPEI